MDQNMEEVVYDEPMEQPMEEPLGPSEESKQPLMLDDGVRQSMGSQMPDPHDINTFKIQML